MDIGDVLKGLGSDVAGLVPGGSDLLSGIESGTVSVGGIGDALTQQLQGAVAGAAAGADAVYTAQAAQVQAATPTAQKYLWIGGILAGVAVLVFVVRHRK